MRINFATVETSGEEPAETFAADAGDTRAPQSTSLNISDTTIVVIEKRSLLRECLAACMASQSGNRVVTFPTIEAYLDAAGAAPASLVLLCQSTNPGSTTEVHDLDRLMRVAPQLSVVVLADGEDLQQIRAAINLGARLYSDKPQTGGGRGGAPAHVSRGRRRRSAFTPHQAAVAEAIWRGKANQRIARELNMCESTVKVHVWRIEKAGGQKSDRGCVDRQRFAEQQTKRGCG